MRILLTGVSSFTGYWFAETLAKAGHDVVAPLRGVIETADNIGRGERLRRLKLARNIELIGDCSFGSPRFLDLARVQEYDVLCLHHAEAGDYRNPDFDIAQALAKNTLNMREALRPMQERGLKGVVVTGSFFERDEGAGSAPLAAFSPYGLSKGLTTQVVEYRCQEVALPYGKFVIPHPFGPLEQPRLGAYLARTWRQGATAEIKTPAYIRDNIHVSLLAACYCRFIEETTSAPSRRRLNPSGYIESQGSFVERTAREIGRRIGRECRVALLKQTEFPEPMMRVNTDPAVCYTPAWDETSAWDSYAEGFV
jgi:nucleoside-diphosphate-sugar epimerase